MRLLDPSPRRSQTRHDALALQPDGSIVFGFDLCGDGEPQLGLTRVSPDGDVDPTFGANGISLIPSALLRPVLLRDVPAYNSSAVYGYDVAARGSAQLAPVLLLVVVLVLAGADRAPPGLSLAIPVDGALDALFEADGGLPAEALGAIGRE